MAYPLKISPSAEAAMNHAVEYLRDSVGGIGSDQAAYHLIQEIDYAMERLASSPKSYSFCQENALWQKGFRKIHLKKMNYKIIFRVSKEVIFVDYFFHDSQDYEKSVEI